MSPEQVGAGVVTGGMTYVWLAYLTSWVLLGGYAASLWWRSRALEGDVGDGGPR